MSRFKVTCLRCSTDIAVGGKELLEQKTEWRCPNCTNQDPTVDQAPAKTDPMRETSTEHPAGRSPIGRAYRAGSEAATPNTTGHRSPVTNAPILGRTCDKCGTQFQWSQENPLCPSCEKLDELVEKATKIIQEDNRASIAHLQRKLKLSYCAASLLTRELACSDCGEPGAVHFVRYPYKDRQRVCKDCYMKHPEEARKRG